VAQHVESILVESARVAQLSDSDLTALVPACPGWTLRDLVFHLGGVQRSWARHLDTADPSQHPPQKPSIEPPPDGDLAQWMRQSTVLLVEALGRAGEDSPCWTWWGEPFTSGAVGRHQVQEVTIHRFDAEAAVGATTPIPIAVAVDGIGEFLQIMIDETTTQPEGRLTLQATDDDATWETGSSTDPAVAIYGTASDLELLLYRRIPLSATVVEGDAVLAQAFIDAPELA
jgi:uncharacterized protein (TIGR03083 family)